ncbi:MAG: hypothetical protein L3J07_01020 [Candidatus Magasanikbacteria bacterium]|nr:hypothetical protein [Candidatus Magasanikbacteria bacterium]
MRKKMPSVEELPVSDRKFVIVESPYKGDNPNWTDVDFNLAYLNLCLNDCFQRGEIPFASHAIYTLSGVLNDKVKKERIIGIESGLELGNTLLRANGIKAIYHDIGMSKGMKEGHKQALDLGLRVELRRLPKDIFNALCTEWDKTNLIRP